MEGIFNRMEYKYKLDRTMMEHISTALRPHMVADAYSQGDDGFYVVNNLYLDTEDFWFIRNSLDRPPYKEKMRLRCYGDIVAGTQSPVYFEIKKKFMKSGNKRRIVLPTDLIDAWITKGEIPDAPTVNQQIVREIDVILQAYRPVPRLAVFYDRRAFFSKELGSTLRVTFDYHIRYRMTDVDFVHGHGGRLVYPQDDYIMEVKFKGGAMPQWFANLLAEHDLAREPFSKVGKAWRQESWLLRHAEAEAPYGEYDSPCAIPLLAAN